MYTSHNPIKTVIITGGNSGIGYSCAKHLALTKEWYIIIASKNNGHVDKAAHILKKQTSWQYITGIHLDLSSFQSIRHFVEKFMKQQLPSLHALVNNAGVQVITETQHTEDGYELTFGVNHLGHYLLTNLLLKSMVPPARIVSVSSEAHNPETSIGMPAPVYTDPYTLAKPVVDKGLKRNEIAHIGKIRYATSKLCNILFTYELDRILTIQGYHDPGKMITANAYAPGIIPGTGIGNDYSLPSRLAWNYVLPLFTFLPGLYSINQAGKNLARLITDPELESTSGAYFEARKMKKSSPESYDTEKARNLWKASAKLTKSGNIV